MLMSQDIYKEMTDKIMLTGSKIIPKLFKMIADQKEATLLMAMPGSPEQLAENVRKPVKKVEKMCRELYHKGLAFKSFKTGNLGYKMCRDMIQFHDATILWPEAPKAFSGPKHPKPIMICGRNLWKRNGLILLAWRNNFLPELSLAFYQLKNPLT
jgi:hypothetical protein